MPRALDPAIRRLRTEFNLPDIAAELGIARQAPYAWRRVPAERVQEIAKITRIKPHELRPDLYPPPRRRKKVHTKSREVSSAA